MTKPAQNVVLSDGREGGGQGSPELLLRTRLARTEEGFDFGPTEFNRIEIRRVGW